MDIEEELVGKLRRKLQNSQRKKSDHRRDLIEFCVKNPYQREDLIEHADDKENRIEELKFNRRLDAILLKRENIPTYKDVNELTSLVTTQRISYQKYIQLGELIPGTVRTRYFTAAIFESFNRDVDNTIDTEEFLKFVQRSVDVETVEVELASYANTYLDGIEVSVPLSQNCRADSGGGGGEKTTVVVPTLTLSRKGKASGRCQGEPFVTEQELERFVFDSIPHIPLVMEANLHESFLPFYVFAAVRRLLFFLDPMRTRRVNIRKLSHSQEMDEFLWLQRLDQYRDDYEDEASFQRQVASNWFSAENAMRLYDIYVSLDKDGNGMLSQKELLQFHGENLSRNGQRNNAVQLTPLVISRIFQENITYQPAEMDFKTFLDLVLALENRDHVESLRYFWRVVDINKDDLLNQSTIQLFYRDIRAMLLEMGYEAAPSCNDVSVEILDMLGNPQDDSFLSNKVNSVLSGSAARQGVTFKQLLASGQASTVISMLIDIHKFWAYDNRESLANSYEDEEAQTDSTDLVSSSDPYSGDLNTGKEDYHDAVDSKKDAATTRSGSENSWSHRAPSVELKSGDEDFEDPYDFY